MRLVTAIIKPHLLDSVRESLKAAGVAGITVSEVRGMGRQRGHTETYRSAEYVIDLLPKLKVDVVCDDAGLHAVVEAMTSGAHTGKIGDGKLWVTELSDVVRIRTGERGAAAV